jgi:hypothetical protein
MRPRSFLVLSACVVLAAAGPLAADDAKPAVSLHLLKATAERSPAHTLFRCEVNLDNQTGGDLVVRSNFTSAFDGMELVVTAPDGKVLAQQSHSFHQSPFAEAREFTLKKGLTAADVRFPIGDLPADVRTVKVRLVGTLTGSAYGRILSTETLEIPVKQ